VPRRTGVHYDTSWGRRYPARLARAALVEWALRPSVHVLTSPHAAGLDRLDAVDAPVVFAANHHSHLDTPLLLSALPTRFRHHTVVAAAADYFFRTRASSALSTLALNAIPIERTRVNRASADLAAGLLADGWNVLIFPEGGRSPDGWGQAFRGGAAYLALRGQVMARGARRPKPGPVWVRFGPALRAAPGEDTRRFSARIEDAVAALADEHGTNWWTARRRASAGATPPLTGPAAPGWRRAWALAAKRGDGPPRRQWP
jgi:1-acyl-sn-glycerol-3-phosphate acyltransferase